MLLKAAAEAIVADLPNAWLWMVSPRVSPVGHCGKLGA
jgi:hypothetical protein